MCYQDHFNSERYIDMTAFLAIRNVERQERRKAMEDRNFRRGEIYLAALDRNLDFDRSCRRPVILLQNNCGNLFGQCLVVAPLTRAADMEQNPCVFGLGNVSGICGETAVRLDKVRRIDKRCVSRYLGRISREQSDDIADMLRECLDELIPVEMEAP